MRTRLPNRHVTETFKERVAGMTVYFSLGFDERGLVREVFIDTARSGTIMRELMHTIARLVTVMLQHDVPQESVCELLESENESIPRTLAALLRNHSVMYDQRDVA